jgi:hypothetical protein
MTLTLDLPAEITTGLEAKAARLGVPVERFAVGVLRREVETNGNGQAEYSDASHPITRARALRQELAAALRSPGGAALDAAADLAALREERFADV